MGFTDYSFIFKIFSKSKHERDINSLVQGGDCSNLAGCNWLISLGAACMGRKFFLQSWYKRMYLGPITIRFAAPQSNSNETGTITYSGALVNTNLKRPTLAITDFQY